MGVLHRFFILWRNMKLSENYPEGVVRGHECCDQSYGPHNLTAVMRVESSKQDRVFTPESRERNNACKGKTSDPETHAGFSQRLPESPHLAEIGFPFHCMHDAAGRKEKQRFEKGMRHQVEYGSRKGSRSKRQEHITELRNGRISHHSLDVVLHEGHRGGEDGSKGSNGHHNNESN